MYEVFYNLKAEPFRLSPDHKFCFEHKSYAKARAYMAYAFKRAEGFVMITGRPGTGKTTLIGELVDSLSKDRVFTANLVCTQMDADDLLKTVTYSFGIGSGKLDKAELLHRLTILLHRWHREGRRALLIVDEAQDLSSSAMEELRLLTNIQLNGQPLLQIFLLGQPELKDLILSPAMEQVHQRIVAATHIDGLEADETEAYVIHRLLAVGWRGDPAIDRAIFPVIHKFSEGVPRRINLICSRLFLLGSVEQRHAIELEDVRVVISELQAENLAAGTGFSRDDFIDSDQIEWVQVDESESPLRPEPHLRAVNTESYASAKEDLIAVEDEAKKKATAEVAPVIHPNAVSDPIDPHRSNIEEELADEKSNRSCHENERMHEDLEANSNLPQSDSPEPIEGEWGEGAIAADDLEPSSRWKRGIVLVSMAIIALVLGLFLWAYLSHQDKQSISRNPGPPNVRGSKSSIDSVEAPLNFGSPIFNESGKSAASPLLQVPQVTESNAQPSQQRVTIGQINAYKPPSDAEPAISHELASTDPSPKHESRSLPGAMAVPEDSGQSSELSFASDSDDIHPGSLEVAFSKLRDQPDSLASTAGFSDRRGNVDDNLAQPRKRADAVEQYLLDGSIGGNRLHVDGRGDFTTYAEEQLQSPRQTLSLIELCT